MIVKSEVSQAFFSKLGINEILQKTLYKNKISQPTPIQNLAIPAILNGHDCIGIAQTGTGKTLAYLLPLLQKIVGTQLRVLIVVPTRELALQIDEVVRIFYSVTHVNSIIIIGGAPIGRQISQIRRRPQIIIATPGRLIDHLERKTIFLGNINYLVLDEADRMFDMGFAPQLKIILNSLPAANQRQTLLFSATMPDSIAKLILKHMREPVRIAIAPPGSTAKDVQQEILILESQQRKAALLEILEKTKESILIFTRTKHQARDLTSFLRDYHYQVEELHSNRSLGQRTKAISAIRTKKSQILVATDIAARGIDISHLRIVINYELPENPEDYVHRIGRTGRAEKSGRAISFVLSHQSAELKRLQRFISTNLKQVHLEKVPSAKLSETSYNLKQRGRSNFQHSRFNRNKFGRNKFRRTSRNVQ